MTANDAAISSYAFGVLKFPESTNGMPGCISAECSNTGITWPCPSMLQVKSPTALLDLAAGISVHARRHTG